jgi:hypothetical protein
LSKAATTQLYRKDRTTRLLPFCCILLIVFAVLDEGPYELKPKLGPRPSVPDTSVMDGTEQLAYFRGLFKNLLPQRLFLFALLSCGG